MNLLFGRSTVDTVDDSLRLYDDGGLASPTRSTVPLLSWLKHECPMVDAVLQETGMPAHCNLHLEYRVEPPKGQGKGSQTDLMVISGVNTLAIEAKWTEPRYDTVCQWRKSKGANADDVLDGWLNLLQPHVQHTLQKEQFSDVVYQMVHRAASACAAGSNPRLAYLVFEPSDDPRTADIETIRDDLRRLWYLLGKPEEFPFHLIEVQLSLTEAFNAIKSLQKGSVETEEIVRKALRSDAKLFAFGEPSVKRVGDRLCLHTPAPPRLFSPSPR